MTEREYSVWAFLPGEWHYPIVRFTTMPAAMRQCAQAIKQPGKAVRIIVTDGDDATIFEWQRGLGITWPIPGTAPEGATP